MPAKACSTRIWKIKKKAALSSPPLPQAVPVIKRKSLKEGCSIKQIPQRGCGFSKNSCPCYPKTGLERMVWLFVIIAGILPVLVVISIRVMCLKVEDDGALPPRYGCPQLSDPRAIVRRNPCTMYTKVSAPGLAIVPLQRQRSFPGSTEV